MFDLAPRLAPELEVSHAQIFARDMVLQLGRTSSGAPLSFRVIHTRDRSNA
jgi:hypothetical protein